MKAIYLLFGLMLLGSCNQQSRESKAKKLIKDHLYETLHDFKSYEVVNFGKLDSSFTTFEDDSLYNLYERLVDEQLEIAKKANRNAELYVGLTYYSNIGRRYLNESKTATDSGRILIEKMEAIREGFKPVFNGWKMNHSYRAKNLSGNTSINHFVYYFDIDLKEVVNHKDVGGPDEHD